MSRKYKFHNKRGMYFVSFATVNWISIFIREQYFDVIRESLAHYIENDKMELYGYCIMPNHVHLIFSAPAFNPMETLREFKRYTAQKLLALIKSNGRESRKEWILSLMNKSSDKNSLIRRFQFWQHHNKPIELWSNKVIFQKLDYIHLNPVKEGFVVEPHFWKYSSASNYAGEAGVLEVSLISRGDFGFVTIN